MSETMTITPDMHRRAIQFLADVILDASNGIGSSSQRRAKTREEWGMEPNPARNVEEAAAQMGISLAKRLAAGEIVPFLKQDAPHA